tara:strand:- start:313 stop:447 length:135 start_codon:yes stop_codon:yes gene_type:complete
MNKIKDVLKFERAGLLAGVVVGIIVGSVGVAALTALSGITILPR